MGGQTTNYCTSSNGGIYIVPHLTFFGRRINIKYVFVQKILGERIGRNHLNIKNIDFPQILGSSLSKASNASSHKKLELLIEIQDQSLLLSCRKGFNYLDFNSNPCLYRNKLGFGWLPLGKFEDKSTARTNILKHITVNKISNPKTT